MKKVLIVGASGLLGSSLSQYLTSLKHYQVLTLSSQAQHTDFQLDMSCTPSALSLLEQISPDYIINLAALTDVDRCERDISLAYQLNCKLVENIALYNHECREANPAFIIQISTDHIYDAPLSKESDVVILNNYAMSKYCGEKALNSQDAVIFRTNFFGRSLSSSSTSLTDQMFSRYHNGDEISLFNDVFISALSIDTLCEIIGLALQKKIPGTFNVGANEGMSKEALIVRFFHHLGYQDFSFKSISIDSLHLLTQRPKDMRMDVGAFEKAYQYSLPNLENEIRKIANEYK